MNSGTFSGMAIFVAIDSAAEPRHRAGMSSVEQSRARQDAIAIESAPTDMSLNGSSNSEVFIVDDDAAVCDALSMEFAREGYRATTFRDGTAFLAAARTRSPACVLLDVDMPGRSGLEILNELDARTYPAPILLMSSRRDIPTVVEAIKDGAFDFIEKRPDGEATVACVRATIDGWTRQRQQNGNGGQPLPSSFLGCDPLTPRERDVLSQITAAASNKEAAATLGISQRTVEVHRGHIMQKLGARNTAHLVRIVLGKRHRAW